MTKLTGKIHGLFPSLLMQNKILSQEADLNIKIRAALGKIRAATPNGQPQHSASRSYTTQGSDNQLHHRADLADIVALVSEQAHLYAEKSMLDLSVGTLRINGCWLTVLAKGEAVEMHTNAGSIFSAIYFVETPPEGSVLRFYASVGENWPKIATTEQNFINKRLEVVTARPGELAVFPSYLINEIRSHDSVGQHVSLTFTFDLAQT